MMMSLRIRGLLSRGCSAALLMVGLWMGSAHAYDACRHQWEVGGELIYWRGFGADYNVGSLITIDGDDVYSDTVILRPDYELGFRLRAAYPFCCSCASLWGEFSLVRKTSHRQLVLGSDQNFESSLGFALSGGLVESAGRFDYYMGDIAFTTPLLQNCCCCLAPFLGGRFLFLQNLNRASLGFVANPFGYGERSRFTGGGVLLGLDLLCDLFCDFALEARGETSAVIGRRENVAMDRDLTLRSIDTVIVPTLGGEIGFRWTCTCGCLSFGARVGYAFRTFFDVGKSSGITFLVDTALIESYTVSMAGPYAGAFVNF